MEWQYDNLGRQVGTTIAPGTTVTGQWRTEYDALGRKTAETDPLWHRLSHRYDALDRLIEVRENLLTGVQHAVETTNTTVINQEFLKIGSVTLSSDSSSSYNGGHRLKVATTAANNGVRVKVPVQSSKNQSLIASVAAVGSGTITVTLRDEQSQTTSLPATLTLGSNWAVTSSVKLTLPGDSDKVYLEVTASASTTFYLDGLEVNQRTLTQYDPFPVGTASLPASYRVTTVDALGRNASTAFDLLGRTVSWTDALGNTQRTEYLDGQNRQIHTDALGRKTDHQYDGRGRLSAISYPDGSSVHYTHDGNGNRLMMLDSLGRTTYSYDEANRLARVVDPFGQTVSYTYDAAVLKEVRSSIGETTLNYNQRGLVESMTVTDVQGQTQTTSFTYNALGNLTKQTTGNHNVTWTYDAAERLQQIEDRYNSSVRHRATYAYLANGYRSQYVRYTNPSASTTTYNYTYDPLYRLIRAQESSNTYRTYLHDAVGNRLKKVDVKSDKTVEEVHTYNAANWLLSTAETKSGKTETTSYEYDANGSQTRVVSPKGVTTYTHDFEGRLTGVNLPDGASVSHRYDGDGQKLYTLDTVMETYFLLDRGQVIADLDGAGAIIAAYFRAPGGRLVTTHQRTGTYHYHLDGLGSVVGLTKSNGDWDTHYTYDEYGIVQAERGTAWNNFQYTAAMYSQSSGLYHLGARHYNPAIGRFITQDTWKGSAWQPWTQHLYAYVGNNPVTYVDPTGHVPLNSNFALGIAAHLVIQQDLLAKANAAGFTGSVEETIRMNFFVLGRTRSVVVGRADFVARSGRAVEVYEIKPLSWNQDPNLRAKGQAQLATYARLLPAVPGTSLSPDPVYTFGGDNLKLSLLTYTDALQPGMIYYQWDAEGRVVESTIVEAGRKAKATMDALLVGVAVNFLREVLGHSLIRPGFAP